ncbi:MAG: DUF4492 domain-containing protein [Prevotellaceae bacterium]|nr:DUF4492 domain-containing protein [Prevotellaceae bacterium]
MKTPNFFSKFLAFYKEGFRNMTVGRTLWAIALIKLFIMFGILKVFFFPNFLNEKFDSKQEKAEYVGEQLLDLPAD